jgi:hypothetical protein
MVCPWKRSKSLSGVKADEKMVEAVCSGEHLGSIALRVHRRRRRAEPGFPRSLGPRHAAGHEDDCRIRTITQRGVSRMREVPVLEIAAGESITLEPGGYHLMLMMPIGPLATGQTVTVEMTTPEGASFEFEVPVERR